MEGRAQLLPCQTWYNSEHNWILISFFSSSSFFFFPLLTLWPQPAEDALHSQGLLTSLVEFLPFSLSYWLCQASCCSLVLGFSWQIRFFISIGSWLPHLLPAASLFIVYQSKSRFFFNKNMEKQGGGVALGIATVVMELEVSVTLWGKKDEVKCGIDVIAVWHFL